MARCVTHNGSFRICIQSGARGYALIMIPNKDEAVVPCFHGLASRMGQIRTPYHVMLILDRSLRISPAGVMTKEFKSQSSVLV